MIEYEITPVPKPRMTQSDKWKKRPCVVRYFEYKDAIKDHNVQLSDTGTHVIFVIPMPKSWSKKKKEQMVSKQHKQRPDIDNLAKGLLDAIFTEDSHISDIRFTKIWGYSGAIITGLISEDIKIILS